MAISRSTLSGAARVCACFNLRRAARAVARFYDEILEPGGVRSSGFVALVVIEANGSLTLPRLAVALGVDRSTLTRNLKPLERDGLVQVARPAGARTATARLTPKGRRTLERTVPLWRTAQDRFERMVGSQRWASVLRDLDLVVTRLPGA